jgi:hypothetical protein
MPHLQPDVHLPACVRVWRPLLGPIGKQRAADSWVYGGEVGVEYDTAAAVAAAAIPLIVALAGAGASHVQLGDAAGGKPEPVQSAGA